MNSIGAIQDIEKLAVIPRNLYSIYDFGGVDFPPRGNLKATSISHSAGKKRANRSRLPLTGKFAAAVMTLGFALSPMTAMANDAAAPTAQTSASVQTVGFQNPYVAACDAHTTQEYDAACRDAANGTVVILRNPDEVSDIVRDGFAQAVATRYESSVPLEFRDTNGPTTMFMFDKSGQIPRDWLVNGSLLHTIGKVYPTKIALVLENSQPS